MKDPIKIAAEVDAALKWAQDAIDRENRSGITVTGSVLRVVARAYIAQTNALIAERAEVTRLNAVVDSFYTEIAHGDEAHRAWLLAKVQECKAKRFEDLVKSMEIERKLRDV